MLYQRQTKVLIFGKTVKFLVFFDHGYKLGWAEGDKIYVNNHLEIVLKYHEPQPDVYRVVGFEVQPKSIARDKIKFKDGSSNVD